MSVAVKWLAVQPSPPPSVDPDQAKGPSLDGLPEKDRASLPRPDVTPGV